MPWSRRSGQRCGELPYDLAGGLYLVNPRDGFARLPILATRVVGHQRLLEPPHGAQRIPRAHPMLRLATFEHPAGEPAGLRAEPLDIGVADDGDRNAREALGKDDVVLAGGYDRLLVRVARLALGRRDEARAELHGGVAEA